MSSVSRGIKRKDNGSKKPYNKKPKVSQVPISPKISSSSEELENEVESEDELSSHSDIEEIESESEILKSVESDESDDLDVLDDEENSEGDELDELDNEEAGLENDSNVPTSNENKKTSKEQHAEQRKLLSERKLQRKSGTEVQRIKSLWEKLRVTKPPLPKVVRNKLCDEIWELSKDVILDLVLKHDASRVVQTLVKYSSKERREIIVKSLKGNYYQLATSSYGKYLLIKLLHYGSKDSRSLIINELHGKLRKLMRHREGAYVVEDLYVLYATGSQKKQMLREFWGAEYAVFRNSDDDRSVLDVTKELSEKKQLILSNLFGTLNASVEKGSGGFQILHAVMQEYLTILVDDIDANDSQIRSFIELLSEQFAELVHTPEGSDVAATLIALANAKERKNIIKSLKKHSTELIKNDHGNLVLITLFMTVDDTVLLHKSFSAELFTGDNLPNIISDKFSRRPILYLLKGLDRRYFAPPVQSKLLNYEGLAYKKTSKKPQGQRRNELLSKALPLIYSSILETAEENSQSGETFRDILSKNLGAQFVTELVLTPTDLEDVNSNLRPKLMDAIFKELKRIGILEDHHLINMSPNFSRSLKYMIQAHEFGWDNESKKLVKSNESSTKIPNVGVDLALRLKEYMLDSKSLADWCSGQGAFVVVAIYEVLQLSDYQKEFEEFRHEIFAIKDLLSADSDNKGAQLILRLLN
ncbi:uncharacterized protein PRCAT00000233001 [Priceomyces carsonii]|uniref:uncharacterized protein n=1 Tax=Priceomyces carsonii TaxID=28549 RepID=UPI002ED7783E|nr:unnamed protein product [Priceomyces carsonii]